MADAASFDLLILELNDGGMGKRFNVTTTTANVEIPRTSDSFDRILITNPNTFSIFVRMGSDNRVTATLDSLEVLAGCAYLLRIPLGNPTRNPWLAFIAESTGKGSAICGKGI